MRSFTCVTLQRKHLSMVEYKWQWYAYRHNEDEDTVDSIKYKSRKDVYGPPIKMAESTTWVQNELNYLNLGLSYEENLIVPPGYKPYLTIQRRESPAPHPEFTTYNARLQTFKDWPKYMTPRPETLAKVGFFYKGPSDRVTCFLCNITLLNWEPKDDPWTEHRRHSPNCPLFKMYATFQNDII